jgi:hypothetical protein
MRWPGRHTPLCVANQIKSLAGGRPPPTPLHPPPHRPTAPPHPDHAPLTPNQPHHLGLNLPPPHTHWAVQARAQPRTHPPHIAPPAYPLLTLPSHSPPASCTRSLPRGGSTPHSGGQPYFPTPPHATHTRGMLSCSCFLHTRTRKARDHSHVHAHNPHPHNPQPIRAPTTPVLRFSFSELGNSSLRCFGQPQTHSDPVGGS